MQRRGQAHGLRVFDLLVARQLFDTDAPIPHANIQADGFISRLAELFQIGATEAAQVLLAQTIQASSTRAGPRL